MLLLLNMSVTFKLSFVVPELFMVRRNERESFTVKLLVFPEISFVTVMFLTGVALILMSTLSPTISSKLEF